jgi:alpha-L-fucosidase 2
VKGLRARGGLEVAIAWSGGKLTSAQISSKVGGECTVRYANRVSTIKLTAGKPYQFT